MEKKENWVPIVYSARQVKDIKIKNAPVDSKTGQEMEMVSISLPNREYRTYRFGKDENGIDRDSRKWRATIVFGKPFVFENKNKNGEILSHFSYLKKDDEYKVHFSRVNKENIDNGEQPKTATISGQALHDMFKEQRMLIKLSKEERESFIRKSLQEKGVGAKTKSTLKAPVR